MQKLQLQSCSLLVSVLQLYYRVLSVMLLILTVFFLAVLLPLVIPNYTLSVIVLILFILFYKELFYVTFDESSARLVGIRINGINFMFTILTAITVSVATRIVGTLVISSIMVLPVACALQLKKGFRKTVLYSMLFGVVFHIIGLFLAYYIGIKPGGTIILVGVFWFVLIGFIKLLTKQVKWIHQKGDKK